MCKPFYDYKLINRNNDLKLTGICEDGCQNATTLQFDYQLYPNSGDSMERIYITNVYSATSGLFRGSGDSEEFSVLSKLFLNRSEVIYWNVTLRIMVDNDPSTIGQSSLVFKVNSPPENGTCNTNLIQGESLSSLFKITCLNWADKDGYIMFYEYSSKAKNIILLFKICRRIHRRNFVSCFNLYET